MRMLALTRLRVTPARQGAGLLGLLFLLAAAPALDPAVAHAQLGRLVRDGTGDLTCISLQGCDTLGESCEGTGGAELPGDTCQLTPNGDLACARQGTFFLDEVYCCGTSQDCGSVDGHEGICRTSANIDGSGLCDYGLVSYCDDVDQVNESDILGCLQDEPSGNVLEDFYAGDCDDDGTANSEDACMCDATNACLLPPDAGVDAGRGNRGPSFTGAGGCTAASGAPSPLPALAWLAPLALAIARRRR